MEGGVRAGHEKWEPNFFQLDSGDNFFIKKRKIDFIWILTTKCIWKIVAEAMARAYYWLSVITPKTNDSSILKQNLKDHLESAWIALLTFQFVQ